MKNFIFVLLAAILLLTWTDSSLVSAKKKKKKNDKAGSRKYLISLTKCVCLAFGGG